jgi:hypothetical protein
MATKKKGFDAVAESRRWRIHHVTVPNHKPLKTGTLVGGVLKPVAAHHGLTVEQLLEKLGL